jgi:hypothetical protein
VIGQPHQSSGEQRQAFQINRTLRQIGLHVNDAGVAPSSLRPLCRIVVAGDAGDPILFQQRSIIVGDLLGVELLALSCATHHVDDVAFGFHVGDADGVGISSGAA